MQEAQCADVFEDDPIFEPIVFVARNNKDIEINYVLGPGHQLIQEQGQNSLKEDDGATRRKKIRALESVMKFLGRKKKHTLSSFSIGKHHNRKQEEAIATSSLLISSARPLHNACCAGEHPDVIRFIIDCEDLQQRNDIPDCDGRLALHHIVLSICKGRISIRKGLTIIDMLIAKHPAAIHHFDKRLKSPLDIVHDNLLAANNPDWRSEGLDEQNIRDRVIQTLHSKLREISTGFYLRQKYIWETQGVVRRRLREDLLENCSTCTIIQIKSRRIIKRS